jgi:hypothetical protein
VPPHACGTLAEKQRRPTGHADHRAGVSQRIAVDEDHRHGGVPAAVEWLRAALVCVEVCGKRST